MSQSSFAAFPVISTFLPVHPVSGWSQQCLEQPLLGLLLLQAMPVWSGSPSTIHVGVYLMGQLSTITCTQYIWLELLTYLRLETEVCMYVVQPFRCGAR